MALLEKNEKVQKYEIISEGPINIGNFANSYIAQDSSGKKYFFKQYKNPTSISEEWDDFINAQREIKKIVNELSFAENMYEVFEDGEEDVGYLHYQAKELMTGKDMKDYLHSGAIDFKTRKDIAKIFIFALMTIHDAGLIHTDLKPGQIYLEERPDLDMKYKIKICDFDFSRIPGKAEPVFTVTTPFYSSPELFKNEDIDFASDRFTAGVMLYEILTGQTPYEYNFTGDYDQDDYKDAVLNYKTKPPREVLSDSNLVDEKTSQLIYKLLSVNKSDRPLLKDVHESLKGERPPKKECPNCKEMVPKDADKCPNCGHLFSVPKRILFEHPEIPFKLSFHKTTIISRNDLRTLTNKNYISSQQFLLEKGKTGWSIKGLEDTVNPTHLNGSSIVGKSAELNEGDKIFIGNIESGNGVEITVKFEY